MNLRYTEALTDKCRETDNKWSPFLDKSASQPDLSGGDSGGTRQK